MPVTRSDKGALHLGAVPLESVIVAARVGTPAYVYDLDAIANEAKTLRAAFGGAPHLVAYAVKANSASRIVKTLHAEGCGMDVVSGAELMLALRCGVSPDHVLYSGVAKSVEELDLAVSAGERGIGAIQVESVEEIPRIDARALAQNRVVRVSLRINPGVDADALDTHRHIATGHDEAKFGVPLASLPDALAAIDNAKNVELVGLSAHIGSQITSLAAYLASARAVFDIAKKVRGKHALSFVDTGGGFAIDYGDGCPVKPVDFITKTRELQKEQGLDGLALYCEPGRSLVGAHGVLVARVIQRKEAPARWWTMIDAGMNDLMRPALYQARHRIVPLQLRDAPTLPYRVVGPVCESSDDFGVHELSAGIDAVAILDAGAYGYSMASRYNGRPLPSEVFLKGGAIAHVNPRRPLAEWVEDRLLS